MLITYCGDYLIIYMNIKSLCCTYEAKIILYISYSSVKKKSFFKKNIQRIIILKLYSAILETFFVYSTQKPINRRFQSRINSSSVGHVLLLTVPFLLTLTSSEFLYNYKMTPEYLNKIYMSSQSPQNCHSQTQTRAHSLIFFILNNR